MMKSLKAHLLVTIASTGLGATAAYADPQGGAIIDGAGFITGQGERGKTTTIDQTSDRLIVEWDSFDVATDEIVQFNQPSADAIALNRVLSGAASMIEGQILADGRVFLVNANGVVFTSTATVDLSGILATSNDIDNADFMAGSFDFNQPGDAAAAIINRGTISAADAGMIAFVAPNVENAGLLRANVGQIALASGEAFTLDFFGDELITFAASASAGDKTGSIDVTGDIEASGGAILLTATAARDFVNTVINVESHLVAESASMDGGKIILSGTDNSEISIAGDLNAAGVNGGEIEVECRTVTVGDAARLIADSNQDTGDGGSILVNAVERIDFAGLASTRPGATAGTGGDITISSDDVLNFTGIADAGEGARAGTVTLIPDPSPQSDDNDADDLPPGAADDAADAISEIAATTPSPVFETAAIEDGSGAEAVVLFDDAVVFDLSDENADASDNTARLLCLYGVAEAACVN